MLKVSDILEGIKLLWVKRKPDIYLGGIWRILRSSREEAKIFQMFSWDEVSAMAKYSLFMPRLSARVLLEYAKREGIIDIVSGLEKFSFAEFCEKMRGELGYAVEERVRRGMLHSLLEVLCEIGFLSSFGLGGGKLYTVKGSRAITSLLVEDYDFMQEYFRGSLEFYSFCMRYASRYLKGVEPRIDFDKQFGDLWEGFLGSPEHLFVRSFCLRAMQIKDREDFQILDLCFGRGHGIAQILGLYPRVRVWAIDYVDYHIAAAQEKVVELESRQGVKFQPVKFVSCKEWAGGGGCGFGVPLPFDDEMFDAVFFALNDSFVPPEARYAVYQDLHRVLKPGGVLGAVHFFYPDEERQVYKDRWMRCQAYYHNFAESIISGFQGFHPYRASIEMYRGIGFGTGGFAGKQFGLLAGTCWRMRK